jgi:hypothetical protein
VTQTYRSPASVSTAAATAPARLAQEVDGRALWRELPDGRLEVALLRDGSVERYLVDDEGAATLLDSTPATWWQRSGKRIAIAGWLLCLASIIAAGVGGDAFVVGFFPGVVLFVLGGEASARAEDLERRLTKLAGRSSWHAPTNLHSWVPRSAEQLAAVERIADEHDGVAYVHDTGARTADVAGLRKGRLERYWIDDVGHVGLADAQPASAHYFVDRVLKASFLTLWLALLAVGIGVENNKGVFIAGILAALVAVMVVGWWNDRADAIERRLERLSANGRPWIEIRTKIENDGGE